VEPDDDTFYYLTDGLGSTLALADDQGDVVNTYDYDVFGALRDSSGSQANDFTFAGEQVDDSTGLQYLRARYYDMETGRFIARDPINGNPRVPATQNAFPFGFNNPVTMVDPLGLVPCSAGECTVTNQPCLPDSMTKYACVSVSFSTNANGSTFIREACYESSTGGVRGGWGAKSITIWQKKPVLWGIIIPVPVRRIDDIPGHGDNKALTGSMNCVSIKETVFHPPFLTFCFDRREAPTHAEDGRLVSPGGIAASGAVVDLATGEVTPIANSIPGGKRCA
jgi:RHS repeat-associated protein